MAVGMTPDRLRLQVIIESANGLVAVEQIVGAAPRLEALIFGPGDFAASTRMPSSSIGEIEDWDTLYPGHRFHYAMSRIVVAARSFELGAIDGPVADFRDLDGFHRSCLMARSFGYNGKWCIHPARIPIANEVFTPTDDEVQWARTVLNAYQEATRSGTGAIAFEGKMIDVASIKLAEATLKLARRSGME
jgi:citrate lyase beta subunit